MILFRQPAQLKYTLDYIVWWFALNCAGQVCTIRQTLAAALDASIT